MQQYEVQGAHSNLQPYLNQAIWQHLEGILTQATKMATQRADLSRSACMTVLLQAHDHACCPCWLLTVTCTLPEQVARMALPLNLAWSWQLLQGTGYFDLFWDLIQAK